MGNPKLISYPDLTLFYTLAFPLAVGDLGTRLTRNRKTLPENRNTNPKTEMSIPKRKHTQKKIQN